MTQTHWPRAQARRGPSLTVTAIRVNSVEHDWWGRFKFKLAWTKPWNYEVMINNLHKASDIVLKAGLLGSNEKGLFKPK